MAENADAGVIDLVGKEYTCKYEAGVNQYAIYTKTVAGESRAGFRIQSLPGGYAVDMVAPSSPAEGGEVQVTVTAYGTTPVVSGTFTATVVKVTSDLLWLSSAEAQTGFIMIRR